MNLAIIPARSGSKGVIDKNIRELNGKPLMGYSIEAALKSGCFGEVMVSTDDEEIADISKKAGAAVPFFRSKETSNDLAVTSDVLCEVLMRYSQMGKEFDYGCCIYPTAPFVTANKLKHALTMIEEK